MKKLLCMFLVFVELIVFCLPVFGSEVTPESNVTPETQTENLEELPTESELPVDSEPESPVSSEQQPDLNTSMAPESSTEPVNEPESTSNSTAPPADSSDSLPDSSQSAPESPSSSAADSSASSQSSLEIEADDEPVDTAELESTGGSYYTSNADEAVYTDSSEEPVQQATAATMSVKLEATVSYDFAWKVLDLVNKERTKAGVPKLTMPAHMINAGMQRAAETTLTYTHDRPDGSRPFTAWNWVRSAAENIYLSPTTPEMAVEGWMNSDGHRKNILNASLTSIGIGVVQNNGNWHWVQVFDACGAASAARSTAVSTQTFTISARSDLIDLAISDRYAINYTTQTAVKMKLNDSRSWYNDLYHLNPATTTSYRLTKLRAQDFTITSSNPSVVAISGRNMVAKSGGTATVTVKYTALPSASVSYKVTVSGTGWQTVSGKNYYYRNGTRVTGWQSIGSQKYYFDKNGIMKTGWQTISGKKFYFKPDGATGVKGKLLTGWQTIGGKKFYFKPDGANGVKGKILTGWQTISGKKFYFKPDGGNGVMGKALTGWQTIDGKKFYFKPDGGNGVKGKVLTGWQTISGQRYYFKPDGGNGVKGKMLTGIVTIGGVKHKFASNGVWQGQV